VNRPLRDDLLEGDGSFPLAAIDVYIGGFIDRHLCIVHDSLRENMIYLTVLVVIFLFFYLIASLVRPEKF
jgi:hypothetical protein